jgi:TonB family protein
MQQFRISPTNDPNTPHAHVELGPGSTPGFSPHPRLIAQGFWGNLKDFLTERSIKLPRNAQQQVFRRDGVDSSFADSVKEFFKTAPRRKAADAAMMVDFQPAYITLWRNLRDLISPPKLPPLKVTSKPVPVKPLFAKDENYRPAQAVAVGLHALLAVIVLVPIARHIAQATLATPTTVSYVDISPYIEKLPAGKDKAGGGGGGGQRSPVPASRGRLPRWSMTQIAPPMVVTPPNPKLAAEATLLGPPELKVPSPNDPNFGDPLAAMLTSSGGPGGGSGIGSGTGTGIGSGSGGGLGPGSGGGTGGGAFRAGTGGVGYPSCLYCPEPQYSEDARKAKWQGTVVLQVVITADGRATNIQIVKGPGLGLEDKAIEAVRNWRFKPALGPDGKAVATLTPIEVTFRLL